MTEVAFLAAVEGFLAAAGLPSNPGIGAAEPAEAADLPRLVLSLEETERLDGGLGEGAVTVRGALEASTELDLESPLLPGEDLSLLSEDRRELALLHGGLVRGDGTEGALAAQDLTVELRQPGPAPGDPEQVTVLTVVVAAPAAGQVQVVPEAGLLRFAAPLPAAGTIEATYSIGRWDQTIERIRGVLRVDACAVTGAAAGSLGDAVVRALGGAAARAALTRLIRMEPRSLGSVGAGEAAFGGGRRRPVRFAFEYERVIDRAISAGGIIGRIPVDTELTALVVDAESGAVSEQVSTETG